MHARTTSLLVVEFEVCIGDIYRSVHWPTYTSDLKCVSFKHIIYSFLRHTCNSLSLLRHKTLHSHWKRRIGQLIVLCVTLQSHTIHMATTPREICWLDEHYWQLLLLLPSSFDIASLFLILKQ